MGVVTGMDVVVILMVLFAVVWIFVQFYLPQAHKIDTSTPPPGTKKYVVMHLFIAYEESRYTILELTLP
jgi:hypothetical protein